MEISEELKGFKEKVKGLVGKNKIEDALELLETAGSSNTRFLDDLFLISSRYYNLKEQSNAGIIDISIADKNRTEISKSLIELIKNLTNSDYSFFLENSDYVKGLKLELKAKEEEIISVNAKVNNLIDTIKTKDSEYQKLLESFERSKEELKLLSKVDINKLPIKELLRLGENQQIEFKSSIDTHNIRKIVETIAAFMNSKGGIILIGVENDGEIRGINTSSASFRDTASIHLYQAVSQIIGRPFLQLLHVDYEQIEDRIIMKILCEPSNSPVYFITYSAGEEGEAFIVRMGSLNTKLSKVSEIIQYFQINFNYNQ